MRRSICQINILIESALENSLLADLQFIVHTGLNYFNWTAPLQNSKSNINKAYKYKTQNVQFNVDGTHTHTQKHCLETVLLQTVWRLTHPPYCGDYPERKRAADRRVHSNIEKMLHV